MNPMTSIIDIIKSCDSIQLATFGDEFPETRHLTNAMNRDISTPTLYFMTGANTPKFAQIQKNPKCCVYYFNAETRRAVRLFGTMEIVTDHAQRAAHWRDDYRAFGYGGADDANFVLMHFVPQTYKFYVGADMKTGSMA